MSDWQKRAVGVTSILLFFGALVLILVYIFCLGIPSCKFTPIADVYASPAWTAAVIFGVSFWGFYVWLSAKLTEKAWVISFLIVAIKGLVALIVCLVFVSKPALSRGPSRAMWAAMFAILVLLVLVTLVVCAIVMFSLCRRLDKCSSQLSVESQWRSGDQQHVNTRASYIVKQQSGPQMAPSTSALPPTSGLPATPGQQHIYSTRIH